jgi:hypothetical protein
MLQAACEMVADRAKGLIGVPQAGRPPLAVETLSRKDGVSTPLIETGEMRASIEWNADSGHSFDEASRLSHSLHDQQEEWLRGFADSLRAQWRQVFAPVLSSEDVDGMVADVLSRVRAKRDRLEDLGGGTA